MRRRGSYIAADIMREYNKRKAFEKLSRAKCKEIECNDCTYTKICSDKNDGKEEE